MQSVIWNNPIHLAKWVNEKSNFIDHGIALCHGVFDILHEGHLAQFARAKELAPYVVVSITPDIHVGKGPTRPINGQAKRAALVAQQADVDGVVLNDTANACKVIETLRPRYYLKGEEYRGQTGAFALEFAELYRWGGNVVYTSMLDSSTRLAQFINKEYPQDFLEWFSQANVRKEVADTTNYLLKALTQQFVLAGEAITDEYVWVEPMGRSAKEAIVAWKELGRERYDGGIHALSSHMKAAGTHQATHLGGLKDITKTRFVDKTFIHKVFESTTWDGEHHEIIPPQSFKGKNVIVADFGHGAFDASQANAISRQAKFLALTVQNNAMNQGFNSLHKWSSADYVVVDEQELRLAWREASKSLYLLMEQEIIRMGLSMIAVTQGHKGVTLMSAVDFVPVIVPVASNHAVDRMGAGDAFLSWSAPLAAVKAPGSVVGLIGNIAGAIQVGIVGNSRPITKQEIMKWMEHLIL